MDVFFSPLPVKHPAQDRPDTNVVSEANSHAESPGPHPAQGAGGSVPQEAESPRQPPRREPPPAPPDEQRPEPQEERRTAERDRLSLRPPEPTAQDTVEDKRRALSRALRGMGSSDGGWGDLSMAPSSGAST